MAEQLVDVAVNIFAKPYQTALSLLSLLRFSGARIDRVYLQFEPAGSMFDPAPPYAIAEYLAEGEMGDRVVVFQPEHWLKREDTDPARLATDAEYRLSVRYQYAFENSDKNRLFVMHNDVLIKKDIIGAMLEAIGDAFAVGQLGQCWNCPASQADIVREAGLGGTPCSPERQRDFRPDMEGLKRLYAIAPRHDFFVRGYNRGWNEAYRTDAWPLPECRINEWGCLVDLAKTRPHVMPEGAALPFGAFEACGTGSLDIAAPWFRELCRLGLRAQAMDIGPCLTHWVGTAKKTEYKYSRAEGNARSILEKHFPEFVLWCRKRGNGLF